MNYRCSSELTPSSHNPPVLQDVFTEEAKYSDLKRPHAIANNLQAILKDSKQNSQKYAQGAYRYTYLNNHVNEDQFQTAKKMIQVGTGIASSPFSKGK